MKKCLAFFLAVFLLFSDVSTVNVFAEQKQEYTVEQDQENEAENDESDSGNATETVEEFATETEESAATEVAEEENLNTEDVEPAEETTQDSESESESENLDDSEIPKEETENSEETTESSEETTENSEEITESSEETTESSEETTEIPEETEEAETQYLIQYLMLKESNVELNGTQNIVLGIDCDKEITGAVLKYHNRESGKEYLQEYSEVMDGAILFEILFADESLTGTYQLDEISYVVDGVSYTQNLKEAGIEAFFGVNQEVETNPDAIIEESESDDIDVEVVRFDENGNVISENTLEEALYNVRKRNEKTYSIQTTSAGEVVVVLDPGHDESHAGAHANGLKEENLNLKIALYCKEELETYQGVKVYLTRSENNSCPYPGSSAAVCNEKRVDYAKSVGADVFVSIHNNSTSNSSVHGAQVFYPNSNYNPSISQTGKELAQKIEEQLVALGLYDRGIVVRNSSDYTYPDGSTADYYAVIRNCKTKGIPAIIVEHAFLTNIDDVNNFLNSNEKLKALGVADATAIAQYYGLSRTVDVTSGKVTVTNVNNEKGTALMAVSNISPMEKIKKVSFAVWSKSNQSDLVWYDVANNGTNGYQATLDISKHQYNTGTYYVDAYAYDIYGGSHYLGNATCSFNKAKASVVAAGNETQTVFWLGLSDAEMPGSTGVKFAVWSKNGGQDDLIWYDGIKASAGNYSAAVSIAKHATEGIYYVDAYAVYANGKKSYLCSTTFTVDAVAGGKVSSANLNQQKGTFDVLITGISTPDRIQKIQVPVWSKSNQSDLYWYSAELQSDGSYVAHVDIANHGYAYGKYIADVYITAKNGIKKYSGGTSVNFVPKTADVYASVNSVETVYSVNISDLMIAGQKKNVRVAVWSEKNGQDDLVWYNATDLGNGNWSTSISIAKHKTAGKYLAHVYVTDTAGGSFYVGGTQFSVTGLTAGKVQIVNKNDGTGRFDIVVSDVGAKSGLSAVKVAVWSTSDQSDLYWYIAEKQSDGSFIAHADIKNHKYNYGLYYADAYATAVNGISGYAGGAKVTMQLPKAEVKASDNGKQTWYALTASNVGIAGGVKSFSFAVWSKEGGQDDLKWYDGVSAGSGVWQTSFQISAHKTAGLYYADAYAKGNNGKMVYVGSTTFVVDRPSVSSVSIVDYKESDGTFGVNISGITAKAGVSEVKVAVWSAGNQSDLVWYTATAKSDGSYQIGADIRNHQYNTGKYYADAYLTDNNGIKVYAGGTTCTIVNVTNLLHPLMGSSSVTVAQMASYFNANATYPSFYAGTEAPTIEAFCNIYLEECQAEGVKAEVAFCQAMKETGFLRYGGNVKINQYNFAGIGSTGPGVAGESYPDIRTGIRAQVQHLKAYGCTDNLNRSCVDNRFKLVARGSAPYVEWLGINENPQGKGWATAKNYGYDIVGMVNKLKER